MASYAQIAGETVTNVTVCDDPAFAQEQGWVPIAGVTPTPGIGWSYDGTIWTPPAPAPTPTPVSVTVDPQNLADVLKQGQGATTVHGLRDAFTALVELLGGTPNG